MSDSQYIDYRKPRKTIVLTNKFIDSVASRLDAKGWNFFLHLVGCLRCNKGIVSSSLNMYVDEEGKKRFYDFEPIPLRFAMVAAGYADSTSPSVALIKMRRFCDRMQDARFAANELGRLSVFKIFDRFEMDRENRTVLVRFSAELEEYVSDIRSAFTKIDRNVCAQFSHSYTHSLYFQLLLKNNLAKVKKDGKVRLKLSMDKMRFLFDLEGICETCNERHTSYLTASGKINFKELWRGSLEKSAKEIASLGILITGEMEKERGGRYSNGDYAGTCEVSAVFFTAITSEDDGIVNKTVKKIKKKAADLAAEAFDAYKNFKVEKEEHYRTEDDEVIVVKFVKKISKQVSCAVKHKTKVVTDKILNNVKEEKAKSERRLYGDEEIDKWDFDSFINTDVTEAPRSEYDFSHQDEVIEPEIVCENELKHYSAEDLLDLDVAKIVLEENDVSEGHIRQLFARFRNNMRYFAFGLLYCMKRPAGTIKNFTAYLFRALESSWLRELWHKEKGLDDTIEEKYRQCFELSDLEFYANGYR